MAFDFPNAPTLNQIVVMPDGTQRVWDGSKWKAAGLAPGPYLPLSGGQLQGPLVLQADPTTALGASTKQYVDATPALHNIGRNRFHNPAFNIQQRNQGPWTTNVLTADRWLADKTNDTTSVQIVSLADASRSQIGDESATYSLYYSFTGTGTGFSQLGQRIEGVRSLAGKTIILSFWAQAATAGPKLGISVYQYFGSGGSPSAGVTTGGGASMLTPPLTTGFARYSLSLAVPSIIGKTLGTNGNDFTEVSVVLSDGSGATGGGTGVQSGGIWFYGMQCEVAQPGQTQPSSFDGGGTLQQQFAECQRFYQIGGGGFWGTVSGANTLQISTSFNTPMRAQPTMTSNFSVATNTSAQTVTAMNNYQFVIQATGAAAGGFGLTCSWTASADL